MKRLLPFVGFGTSHTGVVVCKNNINHILVYINFNKIIHYLLFTITDLNSMIDKHFLNYLYLIIIVFNSLGIKYCRHVQKDLIMQKENKKYTKNGTVLEKMC